MRKQALFAQALLTVILSVGAIGLASVASAQPAGCNPNSTSLTSTNAGLMTGTTSSTCAASVSRTIVAEIKWDKTLAPDPLTAKNSKSATAKSYTVSVTSCDNGNTHNYYARGYFTVDTTYYDSGKKSIKTCV